jgi:putative oxidoreductase
MPTTPQLSSPAHRRPRLHRIAGIVRILVGLFFLVPAVTKFAAHAEQAALFAHWGFPAPGAVAIAVGVLELVAGSLLALGVAMPLPALVLVVDMIGALVTAGVADGGQYVVLPAVLLVLLGFVLSQWGGAYQRGVPPAFVQQRRPS